MGKQSGLCAETVCTHFQSPSSSLSQRGLRRPDRAETQGAGGQERAKRSLTLMARQEGRARFSFPQCKSKSMVASFGAEMLRFNWLLFAGRRGQAYTGPCWVSPYAFSFVFFPRLAVCTPPPSHVKFPVSQCQVVPPKHAQCRVLRVSRVFCSFSCSCVVAIVALPLCRMAASNGTFPSNNSSLSFQEEAP